MANTAALVSAGPHHLTYQLTGDGTVAGPVIANSVLLTDCPAGPLRNLLGAGAGVTYANQAAMLPVFHGGAPCIVNIQLLTAVNDITAEVNQVVAFVDVDAVTATLPELNFGMSDTTGQVAFVTLLHLYSTQL